MPIKSRFPIPWGPFDQTFDLTNSAFQVPAPLGVFFDASISAPIAGAGTSFTDSTSMTVGSGSSRALLVMLIWDEAITVPSVTWNGVSMTLLVSKAASDNTSQVAIFGLRNPASGTHTLAGSWTGAFGDFIVGAASFTGVDQSNDATAFQNAVSSAGASSPASITATSATNDMVAAVFGFNNGFGGGGFTAVSPTTFFNLVNSNDAVGAGDYAAGASSVTLTATYGIAAKNAAAAINLHAAGGGAAASPFSQPDSLKVFDIPQTKLFEQPYNQNLYGTVAASVFVPEAVVTKLPPFPQVPPPVQAYNQNLYGTVVAQTPFNQTDFPKVFDIRQTPLTDQALNINVFSNPFPNNQYDFPKVSDIRQAPFFPHEALNINVFSNAFPFNQTDFPKVLDTRQAPFSPDQALNINLFTNSFPFDQYDWSKPIRIKQAPFTPTDPLNINVFTNPIPILNLDLDTQVRLRPVVDSSQPYNLNLYGIVVVTVPFNQVDFAKPFVPRPAAMLDQTFNPSVFTNPFPFNQYDYLKPLKVPQAPIDRSFQLNQNLINLFPINQYDYLKPVKVPKAPIVVDQALNINLFTNLYPFTQTDWSKPVRLPRAPFFPHEALNPNVFTNPYPFNQLPWTSTFNVPQAKLSEQPYNQSLLSVTVVLMGQAWM